MADRNFAVYWMVMLEHPNMDRFHTLDEAEVEAERRALANTDGGRYTVLEAVEQVVKSDVNWLLPIDAPF